MTAPCVIDIEASGFGRHSYPIEVGYVLPDGRARCMLVRPAEGWTHWDDAAAQVHGITQAILAGQTVYCDGWAHDYTWLAALFEEAGLAPAFKLESVNRLLDETGLSRLDHARRSAIHDMGLTRHRASNDARALQLALTRVAAAAA